MFYGNGAGTFVAGASPSPPPGADYRAGRGFTAIDVDQNGRADLIGFPTERIGGVYQGYLRVFLSTGTPGSIVWSGNIGPATSFGARPDLQFVHQQVNCAADLNRDGFVDQVLILDDGQVGILWGGADGAGLTWTRQDLANLGPGLGLLADLADVNDDGWMDFVVEGWNLPGLRVFVNNQAGGFVAEPIAVPEPLHWYWRSAAGGDMDSNGLCDLVAVRRAGGFVLLHRTIPNQVPVAKCKNISMHAGTDCAANASVDDGSFDPDSGDTITVSQNPPGPYPLGDTPVTLTVTDNKGASATCTATVTVSDTTPPVTTCPANLTRTTDAGQCSAVVNFTVSAADNCGSATVACLPPSGSAFPKGVTTVTCAAADAAGNTATCAFTVTVNDAEAPVITCPANITLPCAVDRLLPATFVATATDNCDPAPEVTYSIPPGSGFPIGVTTVTATATDASGNSAQCTFTVTRAALEFAGFLPPIGGADASGGSYAQPVRTFKLKSTVPVKFTASCGGSPVLTGVHTLQAIKWSNVTDAEPPIDATPTDAATAGNQFRLADGVWHFNLDTQATGLSAGKWQLVATLSDGSQHSVWIQIK